MIERRQVVSLFMQACPELAPAWDAECQDEGLDPADGMELKTEFNPYPDANPALYAHLTRLIWTCVMDHYESGETSDFQAIFDLVERCIVEGDHFVREWAVIGVLEDLQGAVLRKKLPDRSFFFWFGPRTKDYWFELHRFWGTGPSASNGKQA